MCSETESVALYNSGYITSPNYPDKYYMDAECRWSVHVQRRQAIRITLLDFELDVKRGGRCYDYLEVASGDRTFFRDCYDDLRLLQLYLQLLRRPATATTTCYCYDYLEVASGDRTFFRDCGALGRQIVDVDTSCSHVTVTFRTGQTSLTQRGFLLHFEGTASSRA